MSSYGSIKEEEEIKDDLESLKSHKSRVLLKRCPVLCSLYFFHKIILKIWPIITYFDYSHLTIQLK